MAADTNGRYPEMVIELDQTAQWQRTGAPPSPLSTKISATLRDILAWRARVEDTKGFVAALDRAFTFHEKEGHTEWEWTPRSYAVQADLGEVTGAQASLYSRAKAAIDHSIPLLEGLHPLDPAVDEEDAESMRALVISELRELVAELGTVGGPRNPRIEGLFSTLLGENTNTARPQDVGGLFSHLREELGLDKAKVNTVEDEQNLTNFYIVVDHIIALRYSWETFSKNLDKDPFFGTHLVLLSRQLGCIIEAVHQVIFVMDSVFLSAADRQTIKLPADEGKRPLTVSELLSWIERFAQEEAPQIVREAGKRGVVSFTPTLKTLHQHVLKALDTPLDTIPQAFYTKRVQNSLQELERYLKEAMTLADKVRTTPDPYIKDLASPSTIEADANVSIDAFVENIQPGATVKLVRRSS